MGLPSPWDSKAQIECHLESLQSDPKPGRAEHRVENDKQVVPPPSER